MLTDIQKLENRVRDLVNATRNLHALVADAPRWNKICSAMGVLGDTEMAIIEYERLLTQDASKGFAYLIVYGILQVLFVQQDATKHIAEVIGADLTFPQELLQIREMRNAFTGHPTDHRRGGEVFQSFISQPSVAVSGFQFFRRSSSGKDEWGGVNIPHLITLQRAHISKLLEKSVKHLEKEELEHRRKFRATKLAGAFPSTLNHGFEKMLEGISHPEMRTSLGKYGIELTIRAVEEFKNLLRERGVLDAYRMSVVPMLKELEYPFASMLKYYSNQETHHNDDDALVFLFFIETKVYELKELAEEIDKEYESDTV